MRLPFQGHLRLEAGAYFASLVEALLPTAELKSGLVPIHAFAGRQHDVGVAPLSWA